MVMPIQMLSSPKILTSLTDEESVWHSIKIATGSSCFRITSQLLQWNFAGSSDRQLTCLQSILNTSAPAEIYASVARTRDLAS